MTDDAQDRETVPLRRSSAGHGRLKLALSAILLLLAAVLVPPYVNVGRYKSRITQVMSASLGRPVRLSSVELRLFPWPSFLLTDLSVAEDPAYGAEPVMHADTVRADLRLLSLWQGKFEIGSIHVDDASLNLVRATPGHWNLDPLFRTAAAQPRSALRAANLPYLEATNLRINIKNGVEKLPFSLVNTDLTFWQENPGDWRVRLRGQPARTDVALEMGDTGVVRLEASARRAPELHEMPVHLDLDWREAQLGALARLLTGSDPGWRGDLTGEAHLDGTPDAARVTMRLRATGMHRAEFAPNAPLDFDANCGFVYRYSRRALENLVCDSPLGNGRLRVTGTMPGSGEPDLTLELNRIPVAAGLDLLRTMRSGIASSVEAAGTVSGKLVYAGAVAAGANAPAKPKKGAVRAEAGQRPLSGSLTVEGFSLSGGALSQPLGAPRIVFEPVTDGSPESPKTIAASTDVQAGGAEPLNVNVRLGLHGYMAALHGQASLSRLRQMAQTAGLDRSGALGQLDGSPAVLDLTVQGPWLQQPEENAPALPAAAGNPVTDTVTGTVTLHDANWHADYLVNPVEIASATLRLEAGAMRWDPVEFTYGPVRGTARVTLPIACPPAQDAAQAAEAADACVPRFAVSFGSIAAAELESAFLGARQKGTLLSSLIDRLHPASAPAWPELSGTLHADSFALGPVTVRQATAAIKIAAQSAELTEMRGSVLGGDMSGKATVNWAGGESNQPSYFLDAHLDGVAAAAAGQLLGMHWSGGPLNVNGKVNLSGFTGVDLASSAKGTLRFDWKHGSAAMAPSARKATGEDSAEFPQGLEHFDGWSGDVAIAKGTVTLGQNRVIHAGSKQVVEGEVTLTKPPKVQLAVAKQNSAQR